MAKLSLGKPIRGIDLLSDETSLLADDKGKVIAVREAVNVDIDRDGNISRRRGAGLKLAGSGYHSLYKATRNWLFACHQDELGVYDPATNAFTGLVTMNSNNQVSYAELNGNVYAFNVQFSCYFPPGSILAYNVGTALPQTTPAFSAAAGGNLAPGTYGITYTVVAANGEESGTGPTVLVEVTNGAIQGLLFEVLTGARYRIYMTTANGAELYQAVEFAATTTSLLITDHEVGRQPRTQDLEPLPYGYLVRAHNSRLFVATTGFVYFSEAFRPHLYKPFHNFLPVTGAVRLLQPVDGGIFIGDSRGVRFYAGEDPTAYKVLETSHEVPVFGTGISIPGELVNPELGKDRVAVWLTTSGFNIGTSDGQLIRVNAQQVKLPSYVQGCTALRLVDGRKQLVTPVNSNYSGANGVAIDSNIEV